MYYDLVIFSLDVFHGRTCNNYTKNIIWIFVYQFHNENFKFATDDSVGFAKVNYKSK
jgi:hypothetical protein